MFRSSFFCSFRAGDPLDLRIQTLSAMASFVLRSARKCKRPWMGSSSNPAAPSPLGFGALHNLWMQLAGECHLAVLRKMDAAKAWTRCPSWGEAQWDWNPSALLLQAKWKTSICFWLFLLDFSFVSVLKHPKRNKKNSNAVIVSTFWGQSTWPCTCWDHKMNGQMPSP